MIDKLRVDSMQVCGDTWMPAAADGKVVECQMFCESTMTQMGAEQDGFDADRLFPLCQPIMQC